ncbi:PREDICTED: cell death activator CIDE-A-like [Cyprinodon variegatus]|uniref:cell death activator CIDE-A-like n=1 Tax=Cyprinodon variegatus TaxID=28743 RepID=UPI000742567B|nr:PREDICTED: cell death activator CIDE-A-like [Cyprinodon variegatus]
MMAPLSIQSGLNYAKTLLPETLKRSVSTVHTTISLHILPSPQPRCYKVCTHSRRRRRSLVASTLPELLEQAARVFMLSCCNLLTLVLEEDGTVVDSEEFFVLPSFREPKKKAIAKLTFDLYKVHPKDFLCCLAVRATLYEVYTLSYDFRCTRVKQVLRSVLRCITCLTRITGQLLLCTSSSLLQFTTDDDDGS